MDSYYLSLLEGAGGVRRERLPGGLGQAQLAAGGSNQGGGVVRNMCETCGGGGEFSRGKSISYLTAFLRNLMGLERRGRVKRSHDRGNWKQEDFDACDRQAVRLACLLDGSRMSREVHVRFCERPVVESRRLTHTDF